MALFLGTERKDVYICSHRRFECCMYNRNKFHKKYISQTSLLTSPKYQSSQLDDNILDIFTVNLKIGKCSTSYRMFIGFLVYNSNSFIVTFQKCSNCSFIHFWQVVLWERVGSWSHLFANQVQPFILYLPTLPVSLQQR